MEEQHLTPFEGTQIRKTWYNEEWYFVLDDVLTILTDTKNPKAYWSNLRRKDEELKQGYGKIYSTLTVGTEGGKQKMNCANTAGVLRIVMSVSSPKVEPLKLWLANLGKQAIEEAENPELLTERQAEIYKAKGYPEEWIKRRVQSIETRKALTDEWKKSGRQRRSRVRNTHRNHRQRHIRLDAKRTQQHKRLRKTEFTRPHDAIGTRFYGIE